MHSPISQTADLVLPRFSSVALSDAVQAVPAERITHLSQSDVKTKPYTPQDITILSNQTLPPSLQFGSMKCSAFVRIPSETKMQFHNVHFLRKKMKTPPETVHASSKKDRHDIFTFDLPEPFDLKSDNHFFLLPPGLDHFPDLNTIEQNGRKRTYSSTTSHINCSTRNIVPSDLDRKELKASTLILPSAVRRKPKVFLQPRVKKHAVFL